MAGFSTQSNHSCFAIITQMSSCHIDSTVAFCLKPSRAERKETRWHLHMDTQSTLDKNTCMWFTFHFYLILRTAHTAGVFLTKYGTEQLLLQNYGKNLLIFSTLLLRNFTCAQFVKNNPFKTECMNKLRGVQNSIGIAPGRGADRMLTELENCSLLSASEGKRLFSPKRVK